MSFRHEEHEQVASPVSKGEAQQCTRERQHQTFAQDLAGYRPPTGAAGYTHAHFVAPCGCTSEHVASEMYARHEQNQRDDAYENVARQGKFRTQAAGETRCSRCDVQSNRQYTLT